MNSPGHSDSLRTHVSESRSRSQTPSSGSKSPRSRSRSPRSRSRSPRSCSRSSSGSRSSSSTSSNTTQSSSHSAVIDAPTIGDVDAAVHNPTNAETVDAATVDATLDLVPPEVVAEESEQSSGPEDRYPLPKTRGRPKKKASETVRPAAGVPPPPRTPRPPRVPAESASARKNRAALDAANAAADAREAGAAANEAAPNDAEHAGEANAQASDNATPAGPDDRLSKSEFKYLKRKLEIQILRKKDVSLKKVKVLVSIYREHIITCS